MTAVLLLAAGMGTRLGQRTSEIPKALVPVAGKPLIDYVLERAMELSWVDRVVVVTGCKRELVVEHLGTRQFAKEIIERENRDYKDGNFYSLLCGLEAAGDDFVTMNVDHIFPRALLDAAHAQSGGVGAMCNRDRELLPDCMKVLADASGTRVAAIDKKLTEYDWGYIGSTFVRPDGRAAYQAAVERIVASGDRKAWAEMVLADLARTGTSPRILDASGFGWFEVDDQNDLARAEDGLRSQPGFLTSRAG